MVMGGNNSSLFNASLSHQPPSDLRLGFTIFAHFLILCVSIIGNILIIMIIYKNSNRRMRTVSNLFILNMGIVDCLLIVWGIPFTVKTAISGPEWLISGLPGKIVCKCCTYFWHVAIVLSTTSLAGIAVDRFLLVFFPTRKILTLRSAVLLIAANWIEALAFCSPTLHYTEIAVLQDRQFCFMNVFKHDSLTTYTTLSFAMFMAAPLFLMIIIYTAVSLRLWLHKTPGENLTRERVEQTERTNCKICVMLVIIVLSFAACWLPYWVATLHCMHNLKNYHFSALCRPEFFDLTLLLTYINTALNPLVYFIFSDNFRKAVKLMFCTSGLVAPDSSFTQTRYQTQAPELDTVTQSRHQSRNRRDGEAMTEM